MYNGLGNVGLRTRIVNEDNTSQKFIFRVSRRGLQDIYAFMCIFPGKECSQGDLNSSEDKTTSEHEVGSKKLM